MRTSAATRVRARSRCSGRSDPRSPCRRTRHCCTSGPSSEAKSSPSDTDQATTATGERRDPDDPAGRRQVRELLPVGRVAEGVDEPLEPAARPDPLRRVVDPHAEQLRARRSSLAPWWARRKVTVRMGSPTSVISRLRPVETSVHSTTQPEDRDREVEQQVDRLAVGAGLEEQAEESHAATVAPALAWVDPATRRADGRAGTTSREAAAAVPGPLGGDRVRVQLELVRERLERRRLAAGVALAPARSASRRARDCAGGAGRAGTSRARAPRRQPS